MKNPMGFGLAAILVTASVAVAGGGEGEKNKAKLEGLNKAPEGFTTLTVNEGPSLMGAAQLNWNVDDDSDDTSSVGTVRTRLNGSVSNVSYQLEFNWGGGDSGAVLDAWAQWSLADGISVRGGAGKSGYGREATTWFANSEFRSGSSASGMFAGGSRGTGAMLLGNSGQINWRAGFHQGAAAGDHDLFVTARYDLAGDMGDEGYTEGDLAGSEELNASIGVGMKMDEDDGDHMNIHAVVKTQGWAGQFEYFDSDDGALDDTGMTISASYTLAAASEGGSQWGFGVRMSTIDDADIDQLSVVATNYYAAHGLKVQLGMDSLDVAGTDTDTFGVTFTWQF